MRISNAAMIRDKHIGSIGGGSKIPHQKLGFLIDAAGGDRNDFFAFFLRL